jgi:LDH2 family malate/lactate/ureidoglycolate dehydrogenase
MRIASERDWTDFGIRLLEAAGVDGAKARLIAGSLVTGNLRGVDSHGIALLPHYLDQVEAGDVEPAAEGRVVSESGGCLLYDAGHGFGFVTAEICAGHAVRLARAHGIAMVVASEASHFGVAALWSQRISAAGLIGIAMCDAGPQVAPWQGKARLLGTNPMSVSVPHPDGRGWLLDMATTAVALGKLEQADLRGETEVPAGWAMDADGRPTTDLSVALAGLLMPLGGHKGSGLAVMIEILCGVLGGGAMTREIRGLRMHGRHSRVNHVFLAVDVARFLPLEQFYARMERLVGELKASPPAAGYDEVLTAGDPERRAEEQRRRDGIRIPDAAWQELLKAAARLGVPVPETFRSISDR